MRVASTVLYHNSDSIQQSGEVESFPHQQRNWMNRPLKGNVSLPAIIETRNAQHFRDHAKKSASSLHHPIGRSDWILSGSGTVSAVWVELQLKIKRELPMIKHLACTMVPFLAVRIFLRFFLYKLIFCSNKHF